MLSTAFLFSTYFVINLLFDSHYSTVVDERERKSMVLYERR